MTHRWSLSWLSADGKKLVLARALRTFGYGYLAVVLALYLEKLGVDPFRIGILLSAAMVGSTAMTVMWSFLADQYGRRRTAATMALLMALGGLLFGLTDSYWLLLLGTFTGTISTNAAELGSFGTVEQAILPQTAPDSRRTWLYSIYNTAGYLAGAVGSLFAGSVGLFAALGLSGADAYRPLFVLYAAIGLANLLIFSRLSERVELARVEGKRRFLGIHRSRGTVARLAALFSIDSLGGGFVLQSFISYWFHLQWGLTPEMLGLVFFCSGVLSGLSLLVASWLAQRIGLLNTMVFTHVPSNLLLILVPLAPSAGLAVFFFLARMSLSQMDIPTRQSYVMAVVDPDERTATAGITNVARTTAASVSPVVAGWAFSVAATSLPFFLSGVVKIVYDGLIFAAFRGIRPPEEDARISSAATGRQQA